VPVTVPTTFEHAGAKTVGSIVNVGHGGAFVVADSVPAYGERVVLIARFPGYSRPLHLPATVRWRSEAGFGVQFDQLGARETHTIGQLIASSLRKERNLGVQGSVPPSP
jgi:Tfp pilus assembly protein PilZ